MLRLARLTLFALAVALPLQAAPRVVWRAINLPLEEGKQLYAAGKFEEALDKLRAADGLPGSTARMQAESAALQASALLALPASSERRQQADDALAALYHADPEGGALALASPAARDRAQGLVQARPILLHERVVIARTGRPLLLRARLTGAATAQIYATYRVEPAAEDDAGHDDEYVHVQLEPARGGAYEAYLRPGVGGIPQSGERVLRYYLEARSPEGTVLDQDGSAAQPIRAQLSETLAEGVGPGAHVAALDEGGKASPVAPVESKPWYKRWEIVGPAAAVVVAAVVVGIVVAQPKPQPANGSLGRVDLP